MENYRNLIANDSSILNTQKLVENYNLLNNYDV